MENEEILDPLCETREEHKDVNVYWKLFLHYVDPEDVEKCNSDPGIPRSRFYLAVGYERSKKRREFAKFKAETMKKQFNYNVLRSNRQKFTPIYEKADCSLCNSTRHLKQ